MALDRNERGNEQILNCLATKHSGHQVFTIEPSSQNAAIEPLISRQVAAIGPSGQA